MLKINQLAVRPEALEGRMANYDTAPKSRGIQEGKSPTQNQEESVF